MGAVAGRDAIACRHSQTNDETEFGLMGQTGNRVTCSTFKRHRNGPNGIVRITCSAPSIPVIFDVNQASDKTNNPDLKRSGLLVIRMVY
jgi:hypothetical protein